MTKEVYMKFDDLTIGEAREIALMFGACNKPSSHWKIGDKVLIRTVTHYHTGMVVSIADDSIQLESAAWIADAGQWNHALVTGELGLVQPFPAGCFVSRAAIVDWARWNHTLPTRVKNESR